MRNVVSPADYHESDSQVIEYCRSIWRFFRHSPRNIRAIVRERQSLPSHSIPMRWIRFPELGTEDSVCLFVAFAPEGRVAAHSLINARAWAEAGYRVVVVVVVSDCAREFDISDVDFAAGVLVRNNQGYDFGAWAGAINSLPALKNVSMLVLVNDSLYGPLYNFSMFLDRVSHIDADVIGSTESYQGRRHFQSYLLFFKRSALTSPAFSRFWSGVRTGNRELVIHRYELQLLSRMEAAGLKCVPMFPIQDRSHFNPTLKRWRELINEGFPFVKVVLMRDNPYGVDLSGWEDDFLRWDYDPQIVKAHLGRE